MTTLPLGWYRLLWLSGDLYLRHSAATILLTMKVHPKVVQEILGHSQITTTMDIYSHAMPSMQGEATAQWESEFGRPIKKRGNRRGGHSRQSV
jgi:integrase